MDLLGRGSVIPMRNIERM